MNPIKAREEQPIMKPTSKRAAILSMAAGAAAVSILSARVNAATVNFAGGSDIRLTNGSLNPASMTFSHIAGSTPVLYRFTHNGGGFADFVDNTSANLSANSPFGSGASTALTLDTGFLGRVVLRQ